jgi:hypothetical protein
LRSPAIIALPFHWPDWRVNGASPARLAIGLPLSAELRQFGDEGARGDRPDAGHGGEQVLLVAPCGRSADGGVDLRIDLGELLLERADQAGDALFDARDLDAPLPIALGDDHLDDLPSPRDEIAQQLGRFVGERTHVRLGRLDEAGDHQGVDRIGLGALADRLGEMTHLRRIDHHNRQRGPRQRGRQDRLEAARRFDRDPLGPSVPMRVTSSARPVPSRATATAAPSGKT